MTKKEVVFELEKLASSDDAEYAHIRADEILIEYIDEKIIKLAYNNIKKFYA